MSSKPLNDELNSIRKDLTRPLGKDRGRVVLKSVRPRLDQRLEELRERLKQHREQVKEELERYFDESRNRIVDHYIPGIMKSPPDALRAQVINPEPTTEDARNWLSREIGRVFPKAESLIGEMRLVVRYMDVTFETLNQEDFLQSVKDAYPDAGWDTVHEEFLAAGSEKR